MQETMEFCTDTEIESAANYGDDYRQYRMHGNGGDGGGDDGDQDRPPLPAVDIPGGNASQAQKLAMDDFINAPSQERWLELVEAMHRVREDQENGEASVQPAPPCDGGGRRYRSRSRNFQDSRKISVGSGSTHKSYRSERQTSSQITKEEESIFRPDPPSAFVPPEAVEDDNGWSMAGWSLRAAKGCESGDEEEVPEQFRSILSHWATRPEDYEKSAIRNAASPPKRSRTIGIACVFALGFVFGTFVIVGLSFTFDRTPAQEFREMQMRAHLRKPAGEGTKGSLPPQVGGELGMSHDEGAAPAVEDGEEEIPLSEFCPRCKWKCTPFNCKERVQWEMESYDLSEEEAMRANMKHCTLPSPSNCGEKEGGEGGP